MLRSDEEEWRSHASCLGATSLFFADSSSGDHERGARIKLARSICDSCVVNAECLEHALANPHEQGIWAGTTDRQRRLIRKLRNKENV